jgi:hypothetical protein
MPLALVDKDSVNGQEEYVIRLALLTEMGRVNLDSKEVRPYIVRFILLRTRRAIGIFK